MKFEAPEVKKSNFSKKFRFFIFLSSDVQSLSRVSIFIKSIDVKMLSASIDVRGALSTAEGTGKLATTSQSARGTGWSKEQASGTGQHGLSRNCAWPALVECLLRRLQTSGGGLRLSRPFLCRCWTPRCPGELRRWVDVCPRASSSRNLCCRPRLGQEPVVDESSVVVLVFLYPNKVIMNEFRTCSRLCYTLHQRECLLVDKGNKGFYRYQLSDPIAYESKAQL